ncbi:MAG: helix-turn-helix domain-containing protein [Candidatus Woesearchaeota archaeon]
MMIGERLLNKLREFGLNSYEAKIWVALLSRGVSSAGELSDISNVPRSRAYDVLESLEKKGFIVMKIGKPIKYIAVKPLEVIERVKKKVKDDSDKQVQIIDDLKKDEMLQELDVLYTNGVEVIEPSDLSGALRDRQNVYHTINTMINNAQETVDILTTESGMIRKADSLKRSLDKAAKRGVKVRIAAPISKKSQKAVDILSKIAEVRSVSSVKARFCIVDSKEITFSLMDDAKAVPAYDVGLWINTPFFASALKTMFEQVWTANKEVAIKVKN